MEEWRVIRPVSPKPLTLRFNLNWCSATRFEPEGSRTSPLIADSGSFYPCRGLGRRFTFGGLLSGRRLFGTARNSCSSTHDASRFAPRYRLHADALLPH